MVDGLGRPTGFALAPGQAPDIVAADVFLPRLAARTLIADRAFDADNRVLDPLAARGITAVIPPRRHRVHPQPFDRQTYKRRHLIENFFARLKQFRAIATRYDKTDRNFLAALHAVSLHLWIN
jgi:transposase